ncbi:hypothetical protein E0493_19635 [Roseomonas sp. M0104]|uniref:Uncharacterized protein n=1 Tax=Teichococcus coralli TaxID=2545983 RepID=A0A845BHM3_9PROT|nr:hypothetical protein [Pseudoroseomonas coralli]MXP65564.1 hypothetical protein [Pseudoroseomonas coralli]
MIDPTPALKPRHGGPEAPAVSAGRSEAEDPRAPASPAGVQTAERQKQVVPAGPTFDVRLDGETMRLYSELRDPVTNRVLMRLPAGYEPSEDAAAGAPGVSTEA